MNQLTNGDTFAITQHENGVKSVTIRTPDGVTMMCYANTVQALADIVNAHRKAGMMDKEQAR